MRLYPLSPIAMLHALYDHRFLIKQMIIREVMLRYKGSFLGIFWAWLYPMIMLAMYGFVFSVVFKARWEQSTGQKGEFAVILFAGLMLHNVMAECLTKAPLLIVGQPNFVKKVVFPLEILPLISLGTAFCHFMMACVILFIASGWLYGFHWTILWTPILLLPFVIFLAGISWFSASLGVYIRDIQQMVGVGITLLLFFSPVLYPTTALPEAMRPWIYLNPLSFMVEQFRNIVLFGLEPAWHAWSLYLLVAVVVGWGGFVWFQKTRRGFADVL